MDIPPFKNDIPTWRDRDSFCEAVRQGRIEGVRAALESFGRNIVNTRFERGDTALHWALWCRDNDIARLLIDHGADLTALDVDKDTPLMVAAAAHNTEMAIYLIEKGVSLDARNIDGLTAREIASQRRLHDLADVIGQAEEKLAQKKLQEDNEHTLKQQREAANAAQKRLKAIARPTILKKRN